MSSNIGDIFVHGMAKACGILFVYGIIYAIYIYGNKFVSFLKTKKNSKVEIKINDVEIDVEAIKILLDKFGLMLSEYGESNLKFAYQLKRDGMISSNFKFIFLDFILVSFADYIVNGAFKDNSEVLVRFCKIWNSILASDIIEEHFKNNEVEKNYFIEKGFEICVINLSQIANARKFLKEAQVKDLLWKKSLEFKKETFLKVNEDFAREIIK